MWKDITGSERWLNVEPIQKGWSHDKKYFVTTKTDKMVLRINCIENFENKQREFEKTRLIQKSGIKMSEPLDFGICGGGKNVYIMLSWVEGEDLEKILPDFDNEKQFRLGKEAGIILKKIHSVPTKKFFAGNIVEKKLKQLRAYESCNERLCNDKPVIDFINKNINVLNSQRKNLCHGDFHPGNLIYTPDGEIAVIDFNRSRFAGDPYEDFYKLQHFGANLSPLYATGQILAYFNENVPNEFWRALALYIAHTALYSIKWAADFGKDEVKKMKEKALKAFYDYDNFERLIPKWYGV